MGRASRPHFPAIAAAIVLGAAACSDQAPKSAADGVAERGRQVYVTQCVSCHGPDPATAGPIGPPLRGAPRAVLESKVLRGTYPPGYAPKRPTALMPPQPVAPDDIEALATYLR